LGLIIILYVNFKAFCGIGFSRLWRVSTGFSKQNIADQFKGGDPELFMRFLRQLMVH
jgi:hypothetical protein